MNTKIYRDAAYSMTWMELLCIHLYKNYNPDVVTHVLSLMSFYGHQNISVFYVEIKLGVTPNSISKGDFAIALYRILAHIRTCLSGRVHP